MRSFALTFLLFALLSSSAHAQAPEQEAEARASFTAGREAFAQGSYEDALRAFRHAYELSGRAELLYNIGSAAERLARDEEALEAYRAFTRALPEHESRAETERRIVVLEARLRARAASPDPTPTPPPIDAPPPQQQSGGWLLSWVGLGATALAGGGAGLSWALANDAYGSLEQSCSPTCNAQEISDSQVQARIDATTAMLVVTGVLAAATVVLFIVEAPSSGTSDARVAFGVGPGQLSLEGSF